MKNLSFFQIVSVVILFFATWACNPVDPDVPVDVPVDVPNDTTDVNDDEVSDEPEKPVISKIRKLSGTLEISMNFTAKALSSSCLYVAMPSPDNNDYQDVSDIETDGQQKMTSRSGGYLTWESTYEDGDDVNHTGKLKFDYVTYSVNVDFSRITEVYPYDTDSDIYKNYTASSGVYIVPSDPTIMTIASSLWEKSSDVLDYARKCYQYVAANYRYLNANTGIHSLEENLNNGGGDCGNLSAIYISLLRNKQIPSRPVVCIRPDGSFHVWSEFYLEEYGWIPVDVTFKNSDLLGDYFGTYPGDCIVVSHEYDIPLEIGDSSFDVAILQTYAYWYWNMSYVNTSYTIRRKMN